MRRDENEKSRRWLIEEYFLKRIEKVGEESDSSGSERSPKQAKRRNRGGPPTTRRRKSGISARERNLRRLESNERERMRMHSLNDAFEVIVNHALQNTWRFTVTNFRTTRLNPLLNEWMNKRTMQFSAKHLFVYRRFWKLIRTSSYMLYEAQFSTRYKITTVIHDQLSNRRHTCRSRPGWKTRLFKNWKIWSGNFIFEIIPSHPFNLIFFIPSFTQILFRPSIFSSLVKSSISIWNIILSNYIFYRNFNLLHIQPLQLCFPFSYITLYFIPLEFF